MLTSAMITNIILNFKHRMDEKSEKEKEKNETKSWSNQCLFIDDSLDSQVAVYPGNVLALFMSKPHGFRYRSGQYIFINCKAVSPYEW